MRKRRTKEKATADQAKRQATRSGISRRRFLSTTGGVAAAYTLMSTGFVNLFPASASGSPAIAASASNPIQLENLKAGTTEWQLTNPAQAREIEGYASLTSVNRGGQISLFVNTASASFTIEIFRIGWYGSLGARRMTNAVTLAGTKQTIPTPNASTGLVECKWINPYVLNIPNNTTDPTDWASGVYLAKLTAAASGKQSYIIFVVRDDARASAYLMQSSVTTFQAYNNWGGKSLYDWNSTNNIPASKVSFNRPYAASPNSLAAYGVGAGEFLTNVQPGPQVYNASSAGWECNMVRFLEREGYDVSYCTNLDTHANASLLLSHKAFLSVGHDEYWSWQQRANVEAARDAGVSLGFFTANACYWQIRFEPSSTGVADRTIVAYKDNAFSADPFALDSNTSNNNLITTKWRQNTVKPPEDALLGVMYVTDPVDDDVVIENASHWVCAGTGLQNGDRLPGLLGYEVDAIAGNAPSSTVRIAHSPYTSDNGSGYADMTVYTASSGATVFAAGTMQWSWGLDDYNAPTLRLALSNAAAQQMMRNILAKFTGTQPAPDPTTTIVAFSDDFNDNTRDSSKWNFGTVQGAIYSGPAAWDSTIPALERNQRLEVSPRANISGDHYNGYISAAKWDLTNGNASVEVLQVASGGTADTQLAVCIDSQNFYMIVCEGGQLYFQAVVAGARTSTNIVYSPAPHRFWRIRHTTTNDSVYFETSADGQSWNVQRTVTRQLNVTAMTFEISAGSYEAVAAPGTAIFDNFKLERIIAAPPPTNLPPVAKPGGPYSGLVGQAIQFNGSASSDADGSVTLYNWDFGDGTYGTGASVAHTYSSPATFNVKLSVTDDKGATNSATTTAAITNPAPVPPASPSNLSATSPDRRAAKLTWSDNSNNEQLFSIERSTVSWGNFAQIATVAANTTSYTDGSLQRNVRYYYRVRAINNGGASAYSNVADVRVK
jgi:hypothetical protein